MRSLCQREATFETFFATIFKAAMSNPFEVLVIVCNIFSLAGAGYKWPMHSADIMFNRVTTAESTTFTSSTASTTTTTTSTSSDSTQGSSPQAPSTTSVSAIPASIASSASSTSTSVTTTIATSSRLAKSSTSTSCSPPAGYGDRGYSYYHFERDDLMVASDAKERCESVGAHLAHFKTKEEYDTMMGYIIGSGVQRFYVGLEKPAGVKVTCSETANDCVGLGLKWSDGTDFEGGDFVSYGMRLSNEPDLGECIIATEPGQTGQGRIMDPNNVGCDRLAASLCQFKCP